MQLDVIKINNESAGKKDLPEQFNEELRPDLVAKAVLVIQSHNRQPYGASPKAGMRSSAYVSKRRNVYRTTYGIGQSRTPRKVMSSRGTRFNWVGAFVPQTVGGRRAHPPKADRIWDQKMNKKERRKAIRSAISATVIKEIVCKKHNNVPDNYPFLIEDAFENIDKTKKIKEALNKIGLTEELARTENKKVRAGKGKRRGRKYKKKVGPLIVVSKECKLLKSATNIPGISIVEVDKLNAELLAPGTEFGRITLFTKSAVERLEKEKLFL
jgi:large subunit ribosomal protein L4e